MKKTNLKHLIFVGCFFSLCFYAVYFSIHLQQFSKPLFDWLRLELSAMVKEYDFETNYHGHLVDVTVFKANQQNPLLPASDFVDVTFKDVSPLKCHYILNREVPFKMNIYLNGKSAFFGSTWRCFQQFNNTLSFQYEVYNTTFGYDMNEPTTCLTKEDCPHSVGFCYHGYCKKILD